MSGSDTDEHRALPRRLIRAARSAYDNRRSSERLERELAEERRQSEALHNTVVELRFQADTLEKTYSKQLDDARLRSETAEDALAERARRLAELERAHEDVVRSLAEVRKELERVTTDRNLLREAVASSDAQEVKAVRQRYTEARHDAGLATIDDLLDDSNWVREGYATGSEAGRNAEDDLPCEDMISPDLVLSKSGSSGRSSESD